MEQRLFKNAGWDQQDTLGFTFYDVQTIVDLPGVPSGTRFSVADIDYGNGILRFWNEAGDEVVHEFNLSLKVEEK